MGNRLNPRAVMATVNRGIAMKGCISLVLVACLGAASPAVNSSHAASDKPVSPRYYSPIVAHAGFSDSRGFAPVSTSGDEAYSAPLHTQEEQSRWVF